MKKILIKISTFFIVCLLSPLTPISTSIKNLKQENQETSIIKRNISHNKEPLDILYKKYNIGNISNNDSQTILNSFLDYLERQAVIVNTELYTFFVTHIQNESAEINIMDAGTQRILFIITVNFRIINIENINNEINNLNNSNQNDRENVILESIITETNLGEIDDNSEITIHRFLQQHNPALISATEGVIISSVTSNSAIITNFNYHFLNSHSRNNFVARIPITFSTRNQLLTTIVPNTYLGLLENTRNETIFNAIRQANENIPENFNLGQLGNPQRLWSMNSNADEIIISLENNYRPQEVIYRIVRLDDINNSFVRPATLAEIIVGTDLLWYQERNMINLNFLLANNNINANNSTNENNDSSNDNLNNNNANFCIDINTLQLRKRSTELSSSCSTVVNVFQTIDEYNQSKNIKPGYTYLGTNHGVYLINDKEKIESKFKGIEDEIIDIKINDIGDVIVVTNKNEVYQLKDDWSIKKLDFESKDLSRGIKLFLTDDKKSNKIIATDWGKQSKNSVIIKDFNLGSLNPFDFAFIKFKINEKNLVKTRISWGNSAYYPSNDSNLINNEHKVNEILLNFKANDTKRKSNRFFNDVYPKHLTAQKGRQDTIFATIIYQQVIGINTYWANGNWHLQIVADQECQNIGSLIKGEMFLNLGNKVILYN